MFAIIGILVVIGSIIGGYLLEHGNLLVLFQPAELVIIGGAALGTVFIANPLPVIKKMVAGLIRVMKPSRYSKKFYLEQLKMLNDIFNYMRKNGTQKMEADIEDPHKSTLFQNYPAFVKDHHALDFFCDTLRMSIAGSVGTVEIDTLMELDMDVHHHEANEPVSALTTVADSLPGLGIVAAVLGVVITMGALGGPPEEIGHKVAAALVGTFLGILMCYGFFAPLAANMTKQNEADHAYYNVLRAALLATVRGNAPILAIEFARRAIPHEVRPSFKEMESFCKGGAAAAPAGKAA
ncbi:MAG: flagellar motor stator protein MotA [Bryobacteraceae bacterium]|nr:flagellar motor stator protein MotA [Bryobacteraceae bacterium]